MKYPVKILGLLLCINLLSMPAEATNKKRHHRHQTKKSISSDFVVPFTIPAPPQDKDIIGIAADLYKYTFSDYLIDVNSDTTSNSKITVPVVLSNDYWQPVTLDESDYVKVIKYGLFDKLAPNPATNDSNYFEQPRSYHFSSRGGPQLVLNGSWSDWSVRYELKPLRKLELLGAVLIEMK